jgi:glycosyltransferase involved in cell wall biosynthesis
MKIVHITDFYHHEFYDEPALAITQQRSGNEVHVITGNRNSNLPKEIANSTIISTGVSVEDGITIHRLPVRFELPGGAGRVWMRGIASLLKDLTPDVVHVHNLITFAGLEAARQKNKIGYRLVFDNHLSLYNIQIANTSFHVVFLRELFYNLFRIVAAPLIKYNSDAIVAVGENEQSFAAAYLRLPIDQVQIIRLGANLSLFFPDQTVRNSMRQQLGIDESDVLLLFAGQFRPLRNLELLIRSAAQLRNEGLKVVVILIGSGFAEYQAKINSLIAELLPQYCLVFPFAEKSLLAKYFNAADIGVWPKGYSITFIEGMATGLPVVTDYQEYNVNTIGDGGKFFQTDQLDALTDCLRNLITNPLLRSDLRQKARQRTIDELNWNTMSDRYMAIYSDSMPSV